MNKLKGSQPEPADQDGELVSARRLLKDELKTKVYRTLLDDMSWPLDEMVKRITRSSKTLPSWLSILILECLILGLSFGISAAAGEVQGLKTQILEAFNILISFLFIVLVKSYFDRFKAGFQSGLIDYVNSRDSLTKIKKWFASTAERKAPILYGALFSIIFTIIIGIYGPALIYHTKGGFLGWGPVLLSLLANFAIGTGGYYLWISRNFRVEAGSWDFKMYEPNPSRSIVILRLSRLLSFPVTIGALLSALTTLAFSVIGSFSLLTLLITVIIGWYPMLSLFVRGHIALASLITHAKEKELSELQDRITELKHGRMNSRREITYLQKLVEYHESIANTPNTALNFRVSLGFFNSLLLPLVTFVLGNLSSLIKLFS